MKKTHFSLLTLALALSTLFIACSNSDDEGFTYRSENKMQFNYTKTSNYFTICSNGEWQIESSDTWLEVDKPSGRGNGVTADTIFVTTKHNTGEQREGLLTIHSNQGDLPIRIFQEAGFILLQRAKLVGSLNIHQEIENARIVIPYKKGPVGESIQFTTTVKGEAASGIEVPPLSIEITADEGEIHLPIVGTPHTLGEVEFEIESTFEATNPISLKAKVTTGILYEQKFNLMVWGGDCVADKKGIKGNFLDTDNGKVEDKNSTPKECTPGSDGSNDLTSTMAPAYRAARGFTGWSGKRIYERPGYVKISTGSSTDGHIISPTFKEMGVTDTEVTITFKVSQYYQDNDGVVKISALNGGKTSVQSFEMKPGSARTWEVVSLKVTDATEKTQIKIAAQPMKNRRFCFDDFIISQTK